MSDRRSLERELARTQARGAITPGLSLALRTLRAAARGRHDRTGEWGWGFLYDVARWNADATIEQSGVFVREVRDWMAAPDADNFAGVRERLIGVGMNVNGRAVDVVDLADIITKIAAAGEGGAA